jgi:hypothetical protein
MKIVTSVKHWQIFAAIFGTGLIGELLFDFENRSELVDDLIYLTWTGLYIGWILALGSVLFKLKTPAYRAAYVVFVASGLILISTVASLRLLTEGNEIFEIMDRYPIVRWGYVIIALFTISIINSFPVRLLKIIETDDSTDINDYFADIFLLIFWPIGIWFIQPRLNKLDIK